MCMFSLNYEKKKVSTRTAFVSGMSLTSFTDGQGRNQKLNLPMLPSAGSPRNYYWFWVYSIKFGVWPPNLMRSLIPWWKVTDLLTVSPGSAPQFSSGSHFMSSVLFIYVFLKRLLYSLSLLELLFFCVVCYTTHGLHICDMQKRH